MVGVMLPRETRSGWLIHAPAKLNVYLNVLGKRPDGYHEIETLICPVRVYDTLLVEPTREAPNGSVALSVEGSADDDTPTGDDNLVVRALRAVWDACGVRASCRVRLVKRIPAGAGMGGGSSDAAAALRAANHAWRLGLNVQELADIGASVGSDVPALVHARPAVCRGRGELVEPAAVPAGVPCVVAKPRCGLSTAAVYRRCLPDPAHDAQRLTRLQEALCRGRLDLLRGLMANRLQPAAESLSNAVGAMRTMFERASPVAHQMTGSGSAYLGVCNSSRHASRIAAWLRGQRVGWVVATSTC